MIYSQTWESSGRRSLWLAVLVPANQTSKSRRKGKVNIEILEQWMDFTNDTFDDLPVRPDESTLRRISLKELLPPATSAAVPLDIELNGRAVLCCQPEDRVPRDHAWKETPSPAWASPAKPSSSSCIIMSITPPTMTRSWMCTSGAEWMEPPVLQALCC